MTITRVTFTDPLDATTYTWPQNPPYDGDQASAKTRSIERTSNTGNVGATKQQGDDGPLIIHWSFRVFTRAFELALWQWYMKCKARTIYLTDYDGDEMEGQIISLSRKRVGVISGPGDAGTRGYYAEYDFQFEVYRFISGLLAEAGVTP